MSLSINKNINSVVITQPAPSLTITDNRKGTTVTVSRLPDTITVTNLSGLQGPAGPIGPQGEPTNTGSFFISASISNDTITFTLGNNSSSLVTVNNVQTAQTASYVNPLNQNVIITGSLTVSGSSTFTNIGPAIFSGSVSSNGGFTGSFKGDGSQLTGIVSSKWTGSNPISRQSDVEITGSLRIQGSITGSLFGTASNATTASYFNETDPIFIAKSGSFATTGSNTFIGTQTITGTNGKLVYTGTTPGAIPTLAEVHAYNDLPWLERFYNDTYSTSSAVMAYFGHNDGRFVFHNESTQSIGLQVNGFGAENGLLVYSNKVAFVNNVEVTGSLNVVGGITGSLLGTASYAVTSSYINPLLQNVQLTGSLYLSTPGVASIYFTGSGIPGRLTWNDTDGTLELGLKGGVVKTEIGQGLVTRVVNKTVPDIDLLGSSYQVVVVAGAQGQRLAVKLAQANDDANSAGTLGIIAEDIAKNQEGFIITVGLLKNRNTTGALQGETWNDGDILYLSPTTAGAITNIKPQAPQHTVIVGYVEYAHANNGKIYVKIDNGYEIDELHNVKITTASLAPGQLLVRSGSNNSGVWINTNQLTGSYGLTGSLTATSFTGSLFGTASWAQNSITASYVQLAQTASYVLQAVSASFASTASFVNPLNQNVIITGSVNITQNLTSSRAYISSSTGTISGSTLTVFGSGSALPVFTVQGSQGELFSITDSLSGSLFSVNDISGLPILEVFSDNTTLIGNYLDPMLITTAKTVQTNSGSFVLYSLPTASYDTAFFEYSVRSGSNARAGTIMAIQSGSAVNFTETTTTDFGNTSAVSFGVFITGSNMALTGSSTSGAWTTKCIVRGL